MLAAAGGVALATAAAANPLDVPGDVQRRVRAATVEVLPARCGGAVAGSATLVVTARHCAERVGDRVHVRPARADDAVGARVIATDEAADQAVLALDAPVAATPLVVASRLPIEGTVLFFAGNPRQTKWQSVRVDRIGTCPSLPDLPTALFTSLRGAPGDSGAPLVDGAGRIVGLVHGGARCAIATPGTTLHALLERAQREVAAPAAKPAVAPAPGTRPVDIQTLVWVRRTR